MQLLSRIWIVLLLLAPPLAAQEFPTLGQAQSSVLVFDSEVVFSGTLFGRRLIDEHEAVVAELRDENDRIVADLLAEERALTLQRPEMEADAFREVAAAFDTKAQAVRAERVAASEAIADRASKLRGQFLERVFPIIGRLMVERGGSVMLDRSRGSVFLAIRIADITTDAIALIDETIGDGRLVGPAEKPLVEMIIEPNLTPEAEPADQ
jgi:Skp family chaperone for outer membrane proteins